MRRRLPALALASLLCLASACGSAGDLTGPDAAQPTPPRFGEVGGNGGMFGNGNLGDGSGAGTLGSGGRTIENDPAGNPDAGGVDGSGGAVANSEDNGGMGGSGG
jgi:hypothetical protein